MEPGCGWGGGPGNGQFNAPLPLAIDNSGNVDVADEGNHRIQWQRPRRATHNPCACCGALVAAALVVVLGLAVLARMLW